jgi:hypothetical protein
MYPQLEICTHNYIRRVSVRYQVPVRSVIPHVVFLVCLNLFKIGYMPAFMKKKRNTHYVSASLITLVKGDKYY